MPQKILKLKRLPKKYNGWPETLKSAKDIKLFEDVMKSLKRLDSKA